MKKLFILFATVITAISSTAQITIGGHKAFYDNATQSLLVVTDTASIKDLTATIVSTDSTWQNIKINGELASENFHFGDASNDKTFKLTATKGSETIERTLHFTSLPVIEITKGSAFTGDYEKAIITIDAPDNSFLNTQLNCEIKHRGGTTNSHDRHKRNYKFKVQDEKGKSMDVSFFGMREDNGWILDAGQIDMFRMRNKICHDLWLDFSTKPYYFTEEPKAVNGCHTKEIELFVNNEYRGIYNLMEPVDRKQLKLKKYKDKDGVHGVLYKSFSWEGTTFVFPSTKPYSNTATTWEGFEAKYPEPGDDADTTDYKPLVDFSNFISSSSDEELLNGISERLDLPVYCDYSLFAQVICGFDNFGKNLYWSAYDKTKKEYSKFVPTPWDMDATFGQFWWNHGSESDSTIISPTANYATTMNIDRRLLKLDDNYNKLLDQRYAELRKTWFSYESLTQRFKNAYEEIKQAGATKREETKWSGDSDLGGHELNFEKQLAYITDWIGKRLAFCDIIYNYNNTTGIETINVNKPAESRRFSDAIYNLQGQKVSESYRGIVIKNGRKYFQR